LVEVKVRFANHVIDDHGVDSVGPKSVRANNADQSATVLSNR
jgi:hypothetical protein